jgi:hypothetical protein
MTNNNQNSNQKIIRKVKEKQMIKVHKIVS